MSNEETSQVRHNLTEIKQYLSALDRCQVPGDSVTTIHNLKEHLNDVANQLQAILRDSIVKGESND